ncbi:uncharacterized protein LOC106168508 [Lingula anatina]|uniref:Uncharacterized protein LOC106168508 n=1 Tax=Lingula anatina TaxID=7574 RepID=A0A1S3IXW9_LINAN|nr:uncharacterized protein LOC106168508 [Lingula anatina]|eukprot:XP_013403047.1 uncharacterized protein LOC106168508 [Lingula anatina]
MVLKTEDRTGILFKMHGLDTEKQDGFLVQFSIGKLIEMGIEHSMGKTNGEKFTLQSDNSQNKNLKENNGLSQTKGLEPEGNIKEASPEGLIYKINSLQVDDRSGRFNTGNGCDKSVNKFDSMEICSNSESETTALSELEQRHLGQATDKQGLSSGQNELTQVPRERVLRVPTKASRKVYPDFQSADTKMMTSAEETRLTRKRPSPSVSPSVNHPMRKSQRLRKDECYASEQTVTEPVDLRVANSKYYKNDPLPKPDLGISDHCKTGGSHKPITARTSVCIYPNELPNSPPSVQGSVEVSTSEDVLPACPLDLSEKPADSSWVPRNQTVLSQGKSHACNSSQVLTPNADSHLESQRGNRESPVGVTKSHKCMKARWYKKWQEQREEKEENQDEEKVGFEKGAEQLEQLKNVDDKKGKSEMEEDKKENLPHKARSEEGGVNGNEVKEASIRLNSGADANSTEASAVVKSPCMDVLDFQMMKSLQNISANPYVPKNMKVSRVLHTGKQKLFKYSDLVELIIEKSLGAPGAQEKKAWPLRRARIKKLDSSSDSSEDGNFGIPSLMETLENDCDKIAKNDADSGNSAVYGGLALSNMSSLKLPEMDSNARRKLCTFVPGKFVCVGNSLKAISQFSPAASRKGELGPDDDDDDDDDGDEEYSNSSFSSGSTTNDSNI